MDPGSEGVQLDLARMRTVHHSQMRFYFLLLLDSFEDIIPVFRFDNIANFTHF